MELTLFLDHQCNLRCSYCYTGEKFARSMSEGTMKKAVALALRQRDPLLDVSFFGGEPLLRRELILETIEHVEREVARIDGPKVAARFVLNTNAVLVDEAMARELAPPRRSAVFVSLDGDGPTHDRHRLDVLGRGSFDRVLAGLAQLRAAKVPFQLVAVVSPDTAASLGRTVRALFALEPAKVLLAPNFRATWTDADLAALRAGLRDVGDAWIEAFRGGHALALEPLHTKVLSHLTAGLPCPSRCQLGGREFAVAPSGRIYPCAQMVGEDDSDELVIGHVDDGLDAAAVLRLQHAKDRVEDTCSGCELRDRCQSHCGCRHVALTGKLGEITAALCEVEAAFIDEADRVAGLLYREQCPSFLRRYYDARWSPAAGGVLTQLRRARTGA